MGWCLHKCSLVRTFTVSQTFTTLTIKRELLELKTLKICSVFWEQQNNSFVKLSSDSLQQHFMEAKYHC